MTDQTFPRYNGVESSWANWKMTYSRSGLVLPDLCVTDVRGLNCADKVDIAWIRGQGPKPRSRTEGEYTPEEGTLEVWLDAGMKLQKGLAATRSDGKLSLVHFDVLSQWQPYNEGDDVNEVRLFGARIIGRGVEMSPGSEGSFISFPISYSNLEFNGVKLL